MFYQLGPLGLSHTLHHTQKFTLPCRDAVSDRQKLALQLLLSILRATRQVFLALVQRLYHSKQPLSFLQMVTFTKSESALHDNCSRLLHCNMISASNFEHVRAQCSPLLPFPPSDSCWLSQAIFARKKGSNLTAGPFKPSLLARKEAFFYICLFTDHSISSLHRPSPYPVMHLHNPPIPLFQSGQKHN